MSKMTPDQLEDMCKKSLDQHVQNGGKISYGVWQNFMWDDKNHKIFTDNNCACALEAALLMNSKEKIMSDSEYLNEGHLGLHSSHIYSFHDFVEDFGSKILEISDCDRSEFVKGFDAYSEAQVFARKFSDYFKAGERVAEYAWETYPDSIVLI